MKTFAKRVCFENWDILNDKGRKLGENEKK